jgi:hypothetical protein
MRASILAGDETNKYYSRLPCFMKRCPNNDRFVIALMLLAVFLLVELFLRIYDLYYHMPEVDVPSHIFAGLAIAAAASWIISLTGSRRIVSMPLIITLAAACFWELLESLEEMVVANPPYLQDIFFWDGFFDIAFTVVGGLLFFVLIRIVRRTTQMDV